ncbi:MAG: hypothetical protein U0W40_00995 [Acidimicrobiia bacterium]
MNRPSDGAGESTSTRSGTTASSDREREMRLTRKTMVALAASGALTVMAGVTASAAVLGLPILGFGEAASESAAPQVVHQTVYDDHYVTATTEPKPAATAAAGGSAKGSGGTGGGGSAATAGPAAAAPAVQAASTPQPVAAPVAATTPPTPTVTEPPKSDDDEATPPAGGTRPPIPAGCREPEWDSEHQVWHCSNTESGDD